MDNIKIYRTERILFNRKITSVVINTQNGLQITLSGGDLSHIGAISIAKNGDEMDTTVFPGHKDQFISERWAKAVSLQLQNTKSFSGQEQIPVVVSAGVHYDHLSKEGIEAVLQVSEEMLTEVLEWLGTARI